MYRHSPVRNQRSKGIKIKHVLQVCLLVAVCFWLIFQVKRSHDKKREFDMKIPSSIQTQSSDEMVKFGRKDLKPKLEETTKEVDVHEEGQEHEQEEEEGQEHEQEEQEEQEENKHEEEEQEHDEENKHEEEEQELDEENKHEEEEQEEDKIEEEKDDGGEGGGDDEIDENEQEKSDVEIDRKEMETIDENKETGDSEERENEEKDEQSQTENGVSSDDPDEDGTTVHNHEAREEHYRADDASSAVTHDAPSLGSDNDNGNGTLDNSSENAGLDDNGETFENGTSANHAMIQEKDSESVVNSLNATTLIDSRENGPPSSTTMSTSDPTQAQNITERVTVSGEQAGNSTIATSVSYQVAPNVALTEATQEPAIWTNTSEVSESHESTTEEKGTNPIKTKVETNAGEGESITDETVESLDPDALQHDTIDSSDPLDLEEKEVRTDLDTLPEVETEGGNSEDTAAE